MVRREKTIMAQLNHAICSSGGSRYTAYSRRLAALAETEGGNESYSTRAQHLVVAVPAESLP